MKFLGLYLILGAIGLAVLDLMTVGNTHLWSGGQAQNNAVLIGLAISALIFIIGFFKLLADIFRPSPERQQEIIEERMEGKRATHTERFLRILIAILLGLGVAVWIKMASFMGIIVGFPFIILALYLLFNRRHHLIFDSLILLVAIYMYFLMGGAFFTSYQAKFLSVIPGVTNSKQTLAVTILFNANQIIFTLAACSLVFGDILAKFKNANLARLRGLWNFLAFIIIAAILLLLPFLYQPKVKLGQASSGDASGEGGGHFQANNTSFIMSRENNQYVFSATLKNGSDKTGTITDIYIDRGNFPISNTNNGLILENVVISNNAISIKPSQTGIIKIKSSKPFYCVTLLEDQFHWQNCFLR